MLLEKKVRLQHHPPNDEVVGPFGVAYAHFRGGGIEIPKEYAAKYPYNELKKLTDRNVIPDEVRRSSPLYSVPHWKAGEFKKIFGQFPKSALVQILRTLTEFRNKNIRGVRNKKVKRVSIPRKYLLEAGDVAILKMDGRTRIGNKNPTEVLHGKLHHGGWISPLQGDAYVLTAGGYLKIENDRVERRPATTGAHGYLNKGSLLMIPNKERREVAIHNLSEKPVIINYMRGR